MKRILSNDILISEYKLDRDEIMRSITWQECLFSRLFPVQVEQGPQKATTFNWMVTRCTDGTRKTAPRELIHLLNCLREQEVKRLEQGGSTPAGDQLFDRSVFKAALPAVSTARLNQYIYVEYPAQRPRLEKLDGQKTEQTPISLAELWELSEADALAIAKDLVELGFFERRGTREEPTFWVPFLYRDALHMVQGKAGDINRTQEADDV